MIAGSYNITCDQGATFRRRWRLLNADRTPMNLNGYSARMQVRKDADSATVLVELSTANGRIVLDAQGHIDLLLDAATTRTLTRSGVYDLELRAPNGEEYRALMGTFTLRREVTR